MKDLENMTDDQITEHILNGGEVLFAHTANETIRNMYIEKMSIARAGIELCEESAAFINVCNELIRLVDY